MLIFLSNSNSKEIVGVCEQLFIRIFIMTKVYITNVAIPLGAEDSLPTQTVLNEKNKMLLHHFYLRASAK